MSPSQSTADLYPLGDDYLDGGIEERAWVPVAMAATAEDAVRVIERSDWSDTIHTLKLDGFKLIPTGTRSWHRISDCPVCDGEGSEPRLSCDPIGPRPACESCDGTGEQQDGGEGIAWSKCEPDAPGAVEFWELEVTDAA